MRPRRQIEALQKLSDIFKLNLGKDNKGSKITITTSTTPTTKAAIGETPRIHGRFFRGWKEKKISGDQNLPTQNNYYNGLEEMTDNDEKMEQERIYETTSKTLEIPAICENLGRETRNKERRIRDIQKKIREQRRRNQQAAKKLKNYS